MCQAEAVRGAAVVQAQRVDVEVDRGGSSSGGPLTGEGNGGGDLVARRGELVRSQQRRGVGPGGAGEGRVAFQSTAQEKKRRWRCRAPAVPEVEEGR